MNKLKVGNLTNKIKKYCDKPAINEWCKFWIDNFLHVIPEYQSNEIN